jgi:hypothetical protein
MDAMTGFRVVTIRPHRRKRLFQNDLLRSALVIGS